MSTHLKVKRVNALPPTLEGDVLYLYKDNTKLSIAVSNAGGTVAFDIPDTAYINALIDAKFSDVPVVSGTRQLNLSQQSVYTIVNYNPNANYVVTALAGSVSRTGDTITYQAPAHGLIAGFIVNSTYVSITLNNASFVNKPTVTAPTNNATEINVLATLTSSAFATTGEADTHLSSDWQVATDTLFQTLVFNSSANTVDLTSIITTQLAANTLVHVRVRHKGTALGNSEWSDYISFTIKQTYIAKPTFTNLTNNQTGITETYEVTASAYDLLSGIGTHASTDWQIASDNGFVTIVAQSIDDATNKVSYNFTTLPVDSTLYIRVRYKASTGSYSLWSDTITFSTRTTYDTQPNQPSITSPADNAIDLGPNLTVLSSAFAVTTGNDIHLSTDWQIATDTSFTTVIKESLNDTTNKTGYNFTGLPANSTLYIRVRYKGTVASNNSNWSTYITISTLSAYVASIDTPAITNPANNATDIDAGITFTSSAFSVTNGTDTHASSTWEVATDNAFTTVIRSTINSATDLVSWAVTDLPVNSTLYIRVKHTGAAYGNSNWSATITFNTKVTYITKPVINSPANNATNQGPTLDATTNAFASSYPGDTHLSSDWQLAADSGFNTILGQLVDDTTFLTFSPPVGVPENVTLYVRVRFKSPNGGTSDWCDTIAFSTCPAYIVIPSITTPVSNSTDQGPYVTLIGDAFNSPVSGATHECSDWQVSDTSDFTNIVVETLSDTVNLTSWQLPGGLHSNTVYYARVRYTGGGTIWQVSQFSVPIIFTTKASYITKPVISNPINNDVDLGPNLTVASSSFSSTVTGETHVSTDWTIASDAGFSTIVQQSLADTVNLTTWNVSGLPANSTLYVRAKYNGSSNL